MGIKKQLSKIKENWLIVVIFLFLVIFSNSDAVTNLTPSLNRAYGFDMVESGKAFAQGVPFYDDFAPDVEERKIIQSASIRTEVDKGEFKSSEIKLKDIISSTNSFLLNENVNKYGDERREYFQGSYSINVETTKYNAIISQLRQIGEVQDFNENSRDVTGQYTNNKINLDIEMGRLVRYKQLYEDAENIEDKINLNDRIFNQERTVKYLKDALENTDERIEYSTIQFNMVEKQSEYMDVVFVNFSSLIKDFVNSVNLLFSIVFKIIPWIIVIFIIKLFWKFFKK
jgi:hypothetical protein